MGKLCKLIFEHEAREKQRVELITNQQALISRQSSALIWTARKIVLVVDQFPAIWDEPEFKELLTITTDLVRQADELEAKPEVEDGKTTTPEQKEGSGKGRRHLGKAGIQNQPESLRDLDQGGEVNSLHAQSGDQGQEDGGAGRSPD